jgi:hypothetical protein
MQHIIAPHKTVPFNTASDLVRQALDGNGKEYERLHRTFMDFQTSFSQGITIFMMKRIALRLYRRKDHRNSHVSKSSQKASKPVDHDILWPILQEGLVFPRRKK